MTLPVAVVKERTEMTGVDVCGFVDRGLFQKIEKKGEVRGIGDHGVIGKSPFDSQKLEKLITQREKIGGVSSLGRQGRCKWMGRKKKGSPCSLPFHSHHDFAQLTL